MSKPMSKAISKPMPKLIAIAATIYFIALAYFGFMPAASAHSLTQTLTRSINSAIVAPMALFSFSGSRPTNLGVTDGKLSDCPNSPNCVSSQSKSNTEISGAGARK